ncbi:phosphoribosylformylglycinamidine synthase subunit PurQ [Pacificimonas sp. WHA3]|uniref:Phosphoribosylformylglycinamidine synthase subunit PurQ n=1 Tax=Pacificimonas pallii TaxID=2827236 RepID=A0ABS6SBX2_9SPHN|nr:phosphoribosylformylglycinamidine synthase subunit PurQ [Pacificimonas pallii]MBV7255588.1 phosphoribosylformylglycinamidine synthase subunit PurQ [Pacificimonas pallii]
MKAAVIVFPGSNCDRDMAVALRDVAKADVQMVWHGEADLPDVDLIALPGGFSYGDYLRTGAIAAKSPVMAAVVKAAAQGRHVLGVCNGFQMLTETGILPGALLRNAGLDYVCRDVPLTVEAADGAFCGDYEAGGTIRIPVAHHDGNYFADEGTLDELEGEGRIAFRYAEPVNGSARDIAGIRNRRGNVLGMMPHPERLVDRDQGGTDGRGLFTALAKALG